VTGTWNIIYGLVIWAVFNIIACFILFFFFRWMNFGYLLCFRLIIDFLVIYPIYAYYSMFWYDYFVENLRLIYFRLQTKLFYRNKSQ